MPQIVYHLTPTIKLKSIRRDGLVPRIGALAATAGETVAAVWLFPNLREVQTALQNWFAEYTDEAEKIALLEVTIPADAKMHVGAGYELGVTTPIPVSHISVLTEDVDNYRFAA